MCGGNLCTLAVLWLVIDVRLECSQLTTSRVRTGIARLLSARSPGRCAVVICMSGVHQEDARAGCRPVTERTPASQPKSIQAPTQSNKRQLLKQCMHKLAPPHVHAAGPCQMRWACEQCVGSAWQRERELTSFVCDQAPIISMLWFSLGYA